MVVVSGARLTTAARAPRGARNSAKPMVEENGALGAQGVKSSPVARVASVRHMVP